MTASPMLVYALSVIALLVKYCAVATVLARERRQHGMFRYPEDAAYWRGHVCDDSGAGQRAQRLLAHDAETQPYYFVVGALYIAVDAPPSLAPYYFAAYVVTRLAHAWFLLCGRQPHRTRAFGLGLLLLVFMAGHVVLAIL